MKRAVVAVNGLIGLVLAIPILRFVHDPLRRTRSGGAFLRVAPLSALTEGRPIRFTVISERRDAYTWHPSGPIGAVYLTLEPSDSETDDSNGGPDAADGSTRNGQGDGGQAMDDRVPDDRAANVRCVQVICPHLGCAVEYHADQSAFACPCHASTFDAAGKREGGPAPRDLDTLPCRVTRPDAAGHRWIEVRYEEFQTGIAEKRERT